MSKKGEVDKKYWTFYEQIKNVFATSDKYAVTNEPDVDENYGNIVSITSGDCNLHIILEKKDVLNIWSQPRVAFILTNKIEITYYPYKDILIIM